MALYLITSLKCTVQGIDLDAGRIHRANKKFKQKSHRGFAVCSILKAEDMRRKFFEKSFDTVIITHALHHLSNVRKALTQAKGVLTRAGKIIIVEYAASFGETVDDCPRFSIHKIKTLIKMAGFQKVKPINLLPGLLVIIGYKN